MAEVSELLATGWQAVQTLYNDSDRERIKSAEKWLIQVRGTPQAWELAWAFLSNPEPNPALHYHGALILHFKILTAWHELEDAAIESIKAQLFRTIITAAPISTMVTRKLLVALSAFAFQAIPESWTNVVDDIMQVFNENVEILGSELSCFCTLEALAILAQESSTTTSSSAKMAAVKSEILSKQNNVLEFVYSVLESNGSTLVMISAIKCLSSWVDLGVKLEVMERHIGLLVAAVGTPRLDIFDDAVDCLVNITSRPGREEESAAVSTLVSLILQLQPQFQLTVTDEPETAQGIARIITSLGVAHIKTILACTTETGVANVVAFLSFMLQCSGVPGNYPADETLSDMPIYFWNLFMDELDVAEGAERERYHNTFGPCLLPLIQIFATKLRYPPDSQPLSKDEVSEFNTYRHDIGDTFVYIGMFLKGEALGFLRELLFNELNSQSSSWQSLEAIIFCIRSIAEAIEPLEDQHTPAIIHLLNNVPSHNIVTRTLLLTIGSLSPWFAAQEDTNQLALAVEMTLNGMSIHISASSVSLMDLCKDCSLKMLPWIDNIITHCLSLFASSVVMTPSDRSRIVGALGLLIRQGEPEKLMARIQRLLESCMQIIERAVAEEMPRDILVGELRILETTFKSIQISEEELREESIQSHPIFVLIVSAWPSLNAVLGRHFDDDEIVGVICGIISAVMRNLMDAATPILPLLVQGLVECSQRRPINCIFEAFASVVVVFWKVAEARDLLQQANVAISAPVFAIFHDRLREEPELIEAYLRYLTKILRSCPNIVLADKDFAASVFQWGMSSLSLPEWPTVRAAATALGHFIRLASEEAGQPTATMIVQEQGRLLLHACLQAIGGDVPRNLLDDISDVIFALNLGYPVGLVAWLNEFLAQDNYPTPQATPESKRMFLQRAIREKENKKKARDNVMTFALSCRGLQAGTVFAIAV